MKIWTDVQRPRTSGPSWPWGDSFTEGLNDRTPTGMYRGWADRFADLLAADQPGLRYANLAIRGKLLGEGPWPSRCRGPSSSGPIWSASRAGGNDILRPGSDPDQLAQIFDQAVTDLRSAGCQVLLFTGFDPSAFPVLRMLRGKVGRVQRAPARDRRRPGLRPGRTCGP